jgi:hypothetical protein
MQRVRDAAAVDRWCPAVSRPLSQNVALTVDGHPDDHIDRPVDDLPVAHLDHELLATALLLLDFPAAVLALVAATRF